MSGAVAIVGAGPSGCFLAQALLKARPGLCVDLYDRLPVPYGLVRYGVAADHQGTKAIIRQFERLFERQGARFFGNVELGRDVALEALRDRYDAVALTTGLSADRKLGIPGEDLPGVMGSGLATRFLNDHPDAAEPAPPGPRVAVIGAGNVAIDIVRLLAKTPAELEGSDLSHRAAAWIASGRVEEITLLARGPASTAKFDAVMVKELGRLSGVRIEAAAEGEGPAAEALRGIAGLGDGPRRLIFRFNAAPEAFEGKGRLAAIRLASGEVLPCDAAVTAIGFEAEGPERGAMLAAAEDADAGRLAPGLYAAGWFRRGPRGTIPENRAEAQAVAALILAGLGPGRAAPPPPERAVGYQGWKRIDAAEIAAAAPGRSRAKITDRAAMLKAATEEENRA